MTPVPGHGVSKCRKSLNQIRSGAGKVHVTDVVIGREGRAAGEPAAEARPGRSERAIRHSTIDPRPSMLPVRAEQTAEKSRRPLNAGPVGQMEPVDVFVHVRPK